MTNLPEQPETPDLWSDKIGKLVEAGFATVSRNPSDHEIVLAYRMAIHLALTGKQTEQWEGPPYEYGVTWGPDEGPGATDRFLPEQPETVEVVQYAAIGESSTVGPRWYIWRSGRSGNYVGGHIADHAQALSIADELNRLASHPTPAGASMPDDAVERMREALSYAAMRLGLLAAEADPSNQDKIWEWAKEASAVLAAMRDDREVALPVGDTIKNPARAKPGQRHFIGDVGPDRSAAMLYDAVERPTGEWRPVDGSEQLKGLRRSPKYYPAIGETCRISGPNCDDADGYTWATIEVLWRDDLFIVTRVPGCWPTVTKLELALFEPSLATNAPDAAKREDRT